MNKRIQWIDILKGIAMILVIAGHTISGVPRSIIFSFHMPLFFALSGYTYKLASDGGGVMHRIRKDCKHLLLPAYAIWIIRWPVLMLRDHVVYTIPQFMLSGLYASGTRTYVGSIEVPAFGMMWFLVVLFIIRLIYCLLCCVVKNDIERTIIAVGMCFFGLYIKTYLPFSFDVTMVALIFFCIGQMFQKTNLNSHTILKILISGIIWGGILMVLLYKHTHFELATREYPYGPISILMAISGCYCLMIIISNATERIEIQRVKNWFEYIGRHSLLLFGIHAFDIIWYPYLKNVLCGGSEVLVFLLRITIDLIIFMSILVLKKKRTCSTKA